ncbi:hypothetical protein RFI_12842 [Reticulomyxa filosa]|uniref:Uncharacterized protein n=1 Tax=Reticulomyxa filosa TaxID=46433 RepID=X6NEC4_RETFI|nr:hypothetical protein RFI_12842 [Reticulomyxa filosa]|eukprot:ETO24316.1 hypothetical protein RFI_12842 [Reticulomyxa filosa]
MLAKLGRGFSDIVSHRERIYQKIDHLLKMANTPVLTDVEVVCQESDVEMYPSPVPDLFEHGPVIAAIRYTKEDKKEDDKPDTIVVRGLDVQGNTQNIVANVVKTKLPVDKIFIKEKLDLLSAQAWFSEDQQVERQVVQTSVEHSLPTPFTSLIAFEARQEDLEKKGLLVDENQTNDGFDSIVKSKTWATVRNNKGTVSALAIGGTAIALAATAATFGDIQATFENIPVLDSGLPDMYFFKLDEQTTNKSKLLFFVVLPKQYSYCSCLCEVCSVRAMLCFLFVASTFFPSSSDLFRFFFFLIRFSFCVFAMLCYKLRLNTNKFISVEKANKVISYALKMSTIAQ